MNVYEMAHRWCNCDFGKNGGWRNSACHISYNEDRFYSYDTVYAMWLDKTEGHKLMVVMDKGCSVTSSKHLDAIWSAIPKGVKVISTSLNNGYGYHRSVEFSRKSWREKLPYALLEEVVKMVESFKDSRTIETRGLLGSIKKRIGEINWLFENCEECKVGEFNKYLALKNDRGAKKMFKLVRKNLSAEGLVDSYCGEGALKAYYERIKPQLKAERTREFVAWFNRTHRTSPHGGYTMKEIKKMPIAEKVMLACYPKKEGWEIDNQFWLTQEKRNRRLGVYLMGESEGLEARHIAKSDVVVNRFTGERYEFVRCGRIWDLRGEKKDFACHIRWQKGYDAPSIDLSEYKKLANKDQWLKRFYQKCAIISQRKRELNTWIEMQFYSDEALNQCSEKQLAAYNKIQLKFAQFLADEEARKLAEEQERKRLEEEKIRLEEERKLKYNDYVSRGIEGYRALYYEKLDDISVSGSFGDEFFFGGNVLLRWKTDKLIETSKHIILTIPQARNIYGIVSKWHHCPTEFVSCKLKTESGDYNAQSYENDILTAGCHQVAWCEMDRMYNEILKREIA